MRIAGRRGLHAAGVLTGLVALAIACGGSSGPPADRAPVSELAVEGVERVFVTRSFGGSLPAVLLHLEFHPSVPASPIFEAMGSDGQLYKGAVPEGSKICGFPAYLGIGPDAGREGNKRTIAFLVPPGVTLTQLQWRTASETSARSVPLPEETLVCTPPVG